MQANTIVAAIHRVDNQVVLVTAPSKEIPVYHKRTFGKLTVALQEFSQCSKGYKGFTPSNAC